MPSSFPVGAGKTVNVQGKLSARKPPVKPMIGKLKDLSVLNNCGCAFGYKYNSPESVFVINDAEEKAWINIDGEDVELEFIRYTDAENKEGLKIGSKYSSIYEADGIKVLVVFTITGFCTTDPECGATELKTAITVKKGNRKQTVKAKGSCSCT